MIPLEPVAIRSGTPPDAATLAPFAARVFHETFAHLSDQREMSVYLAEAFSEARVSAELRDPEYAFYLGYAAGELAGYVILRTGYVPACADGKRPIELKRLYVDQRWHGRGVAAALMERALQHARDGGYETMWLGVWELNPRARAFYSKFGFKHVGEHPFQFAGEQQTDMVLELRIANCE